MPHASLRRPLLRRPQRRQVPAPTRHEVPPHRGPVNRQSMTPHCHRARRDPVTTRPPVAGPHALLEPPVLLFDPTHAPTTMHSGPQPKLRTICIIHWRLLHPEAVKGSLRSASPPLTASPSSVSSCAVGGGLAALHPTSAERYRHRLKTFLARAIPPLRTMRRAHIPSLVVPRAHDPIPNRRHVTHHAAVPRTFPMNHLYTAPFHSTPVTPGHARASA